MSKTFALLALALVAACAVWLWVSLRRYAARRREQDARAVAFMAEAIRAARNRGDSAGTRQNSA